MRKAILLIAATGICSTSIAQPVLTAATTNPVPGDSYRIYRCDAAGITQGASGASVTWDFTSLSAIDTNTVKGHVTCASTPYCSTYTASNLAGDGINMGYMYYTTDASKFSYLGVQFPTVSWTSVCSDPMDYLHYPFAYTNSFTDTYWEVSTVSGNTRHSFGNLTITADAHGTLKLPYGVFNNVLRVHRSQIYKDSIVGGAVTEKQNDTYTWYVTGVHHPILEVAFIQNPIGSTPVENVGYIKVSPTAIQELNSLAGKVNVYPNPSDGKFTVKAIAASNEPVTITVSNTFGQVISRVEGLANKDTEISLNAPAGIYYLTVAIAYDKCAGKIIIK